MPPDTPFRTPDEWLDAAAKELVEGAGDNAAECRDWLQHFLAQRPPEPDRAAGLNADGSEKAVRAIARVDAAGSWVATIYGTWDGTTFTPDGAP